MNIGYFNARGLNNVEHWFALEIEELRKRGHNVRVFSLRYNHPTKKDVEWMDFAHFHFAQVADAFKRIGVPFAISPHANDIFVDNGKRLLRASKHPKCKFVTFQSFYHKKKFLEWGIEKPLVHLPMSVRVNLFKRDEKSLENFEHQKIIAGGRLIPKKGLHRIIKLNHLTIFGDGPLLESLRKLNPKIKFTGWLDGEELKSLYSQSCLFLNPSIVDEYGDRDGIPNTIKEAMLMKLQVISSPISGISELENIYLLEEWNNIEEYINNLKLTPNYAGEREIIKKFSPEICVDKLIGAIEEHV